MKRVIYLGFTDIKEHIDLSFLGEKEVSTKLFIKGHLRSNGQTVQNIDSTNIYFTGEIPDEYDLRIEAIIAAVGGENVIKDLISKYQAKHADVILGIPSRTSDTIEDGYISCKTMQKLCDLGLGLQFYYI